MQSKFLINILAFFALIGLSAFAAVTLFPLNQETKNTENSKKIKGSVSNRVLGEKERELLESNLLVLNEKKAFLEESISENEKSSSELSDSILLLREKRRVLALDIEKLESKKVTLTATLSELLLQSNDMKDVALAEVAAKGKVTNSLNNLSLQLSDVKEENEKLRKQIISAKDSFETQVIENRLALKLANSKLINIENEALEKRVVLEKEIVALSSRVQGLILENKRNSDLLYNEKQQLVEQFKLKEKTLKVTNQNQNEIEKLKILKTNFERLNGLRVIFSGNMIYDESASQIVFQADNSIGIPIFQDDFTGSIAGKCGLPIDKEIENRCSATIIAEFVVGNAGLFLRGKEIVEIVRK